jgi:hypothetical protein
MPRKLDDIVIRTRLEVNISFWQAIKLRVSGIGNVLAKHLKTSIENRAHDDELRRAIKEKDAAYRHRTLS